MEFINNTIHPALNFEGIDQHDQEFHVIVMRQTYTWNDKGLLVLAEEQEPLCMEDKIVDPNNLMSGVIEESDLCHYKPKCDIIIQGHAYTPKYRENKQDYKVSLQVQTPNKFIFKEAIPASKYRFAQQKKSKHNDKQYSKGDLLINKTLIVLSPRYAQIHSESVTGNLRYTIKIKPFHEKTSLNPSSSFGGYSMIEESHTVMTELEKRYAQALIAKEDRKNIRFHNNHGVIAYFQQNNHNPYGSGYQSSLYFNLIKPQKVHLPQIHTTDSFVSEALLNKMAKKELSEHTYSSLVAGFGIMAKSHPQRHKYLGKVGKEFIDSGGTVPKDFDFAIWNCAYPDQQVEKLIGNEWITLTNLCHKDTTASYQTNKGDTQLRLYLPETLAYLLTNSNKSDMPASELPIKLDTVMIKPDEEKVNLVWRGIISAEYDPKLTVLETIDREKQQKILQQHCTQKGEIIRPYERKEA